MRECEWGAWELDQEKSTFRWAQTQSTQILAELNLFPESGNSRPHFNSRWQKQERAGGEKDVTREQPGNLITRDVKAIQLPGNVDVRDHIRLEERMSYFGTFKSDVIVNQDSLSKSFTCWWIFWLDVKLRTKQALIKNLVFLSSLGVFL